MKRVKQIIVGIAVLFSVIGCESVKPYQRVYLNDHEMNTGISESARFDYEFQAYREGATGGRGSRGSGGCGCN